MNQTIVAYHASNRRFEEFSLDTLSVTSLGFHFAETPELAANAAIKAGKHNPEVWAFELTLENPLQVPGLDNGFAAFRLLDKMFSEGLLTEEQYYVYMDRYDEIEEGDSFDMPQEVNSLMRDLLAELNHDGFAYFNTFDSGLNLEDTGQDVEPAMSWIVLDPAKISKPLHKVEMAKAEKPGFR